MLPYGCEGLRVRRMAVLWTFRRLFTGHPVPRELMRNELLDVTILVSATAYHRRSYAERYSKFISMASNEHPVWRNHGQEAKRGWTGGQRIPWNGEAMGSLLLPCAPPGVPDRDRGPEPCHASGAAVDGCSDSLAWAQRADRVADGGVVSVSRALSGSPHAP